MRSIKKSQQANVRVGISKQHDLRFNNLQIIRAHLTVATIAEATARDTFILFDMSGKFVLN